MSSPATRENIIELEPLSDEEGGLTQDELFASAGVTLLSVPYFSQENEFSWCYAGCAQMILAAYDISVEQCEIVSFVKSPDCCEDPDLPICVDSGCDPEDISLIYHHFDVSSVRRLPPGIISLSRLQDELRAGRPVEVVLQSIEQPDSFHAVIVKGFVDDLLFIHDPNPFEEPIGGAQFSYKQFYDDLVDGDFFTWNETWTGFPEIQ